MLRLIVHSRILKNDEVFRLFCSFIHVHFIRMHKTCKNLRFISGTDLNLIPFRLARVTNNVLFKLRSYYLKRAIDTCGWVGLKFGSQIFRQTRRHGARGCGRDLARRAIKSTADAATGRLTQSASSSSRLLTRISENLDGSRASADYKNAPRVTKQPRSKSRSFAARLNSAAR